MTRTSLLCASALVLANAACNGTTADGSPASGTTTTAATTTAATTGSGSGSGSAATSGAGGASGTSSTSSGTGGSGGSVVTLTLDSFTVAPGGEVYYCQNFANPFGGQDTDIQEFESHMAQGSHHMLLFYEPNVTANGPLEMCSGLEFTATPYGSQALDDSLSFPAGIGAFLPGTDGLRIQSHYLNTTPNMITAHVEVRLHPSAPGSVQTQAAVLFVVDTNINVAPNSSAVVMNDCTLPQDMNILRTSSHMHMHGTAFDATIAGNTVYETTSWSDPKPELYTPADVFKQGDPLHFQCSFTNTGTTALTFGESALTNEMCIFTASFYPAPAGQATIGASNCVPSQH